MTLPDSVCDNNDPIWKIDTFEVSDKSQLPIKSLKYGPLHQGNLLKGIDKNNVRRWHSLFIYLCSLLSNTPFYNKAKWFRFAGFLNKIFFLIFPKNML